MHFEIIYFTYMYAIFFLQIAFKFYGSSSKPVKWKKMQKFASI